MIPPFDPEGDLPPGRHPEAQHGVSSENDSVVENITHTS